MTQLQVQFKENNHITFHLFDTQRRIILRRKYIYKYIYILFFSPQIWCRLFESLEKKNLNKQNSSIFLYLCD